MQYVVAKCTKAVSESILCLAEAAKAKNVLLSYSVIGRALVSTVCLHCTATVCASVLSFSVV